MCFLGGARVFIPAIPADQRFVPSLGGDLSSTLRREQATWSRDLLLDNMAGGITNRTAARPCRYPCDDDDDCDDIHSDNDSCADPYSHSTVVLDVADLKLPLSRIRSAYLQMGLGTQRAGQPSTSHGFLSNGSGTSLADRG